MCTVSIFFILNNFFLIFPLFSFFFFLLFFSSLTGRLSVAGPATGEAREGPGEGGLAHGRQGTASPDLGEVALASNRQGRPSLDPMSGASPMADEVELAGCSRSPVTGPAIGETYWEKKRKKISNSINMQNPNDEEWVYLSFKRH